MDRQKLRWLVTALVFFTSSSAAQIYQWRDASGRLQFGDRPPEHAQPGIVEQRQERTSRTSELNILHHGFTLSEPASERIQQGITTMLSVYTGVLGLDVRGDVAVNLHLINSKGEFDSWVQQRTGLPANPGIVGVYVTASREVAVWNRGDEERIVQTILHESSHVILAQLAPRAPSWLHEGMARYLQTLQPDNGAVHIPPHEPSLIQIRAWLANGELVSLRDYFNIPEQRWRTMAHNMDAIPYTVAWGTVYFLMSSPVGQQTLRRLLHDLEKSGQWPTAESINDRYPGGLTRMDYDFFRWAQGDIRPHRY
ncbi:MAG: DUF4124 domain-containing protein [Alcanivoracaceae bacterium]